MFCKECGAENKDDAKFCKSCGAELSSGDKPQKTTKDNKINNNTNNLEVKKSKEPKESKELDSKQLEKKKSKLNWKILSIAGGGLLIAIIALIIVLFNSTKINLNDYVRFEEKGCNGYAKVYAHIMWDKMASKEENKFKKANISKDSVKYTLENIIQIKLKNNSKLSKGDEVKYTWKVNNEYLKSIGLRVKYSNGTYELKKVKKGKKADLFDSLKVNFLGEQGSGYYEISFNNHKLKDKYFVCDQNESLRNKDEIVIKINKELVDELITQTGIIPTKSERKYTVEGLDGMISSAKEITKEVFENIKKDASDELEAYFADSYDETASDFEYVGYIFNSPKKNDGYVDNYMYVIYKATISSKEGDFSPTAVYIPVEFSSIVRTGKELSYNSGNVYNCTSEIPSTTESIFDLKAWITGYLSPKDLINDIVTKNKDDYKSEMSDSISKLQ